MKTLSWNQLRQFGLIKNGKGRKIHPKQGSIAEEYVNLNGYRSPSCAYPYSHAKPLLTQKFAKWVVDKYPSSQVAEYLTA